MNYQFAYKKILNEIIREKSQDNKESFMLIEKASKSGKFPRSASKKVTKNYSFYQNIEQKDSESNLRFYLRIIRYEIAKKISIFENESCKKFQEICFLGLPIAPFTTYRFTSLSVEDIQKISFELNLELDALINQICYFSINDIGKSFSRAELTLDREIRQKCNMSEVEELIGLIKKSGDKLRETKKQIDNFFWHKIIETKPIFVYSDIEIHLLHFLMDEFENFNLSLQNYSNHWLGINSSPFQSSNSFESMGPTEDEILSFIQAENEDVRAFIINYIPKLEIHEQHFLSIPQNMRYYLDRIQFLNETIISFMNFALPGHYQPPPSKMQEFISRYYYKIVNSYRSIIDKEN